MGGGASAQRKEGLVKELFQLLDQNYDGAIKKGELRNLRQALSLSPEISWGMDGLTNEAVLGYVDRMLDTVDGRSGWFGGLFSPKDGALSETELELWFEKMGWGEMQIRLMRDSVRQWKDGALEVGATEEGAVPSDWWNVELPDVVVVRKEARALTKEESGRVGAAIVKMRENKSGPGTSEYFRCAIIHGGLPPISRDEAPVYCVHGREAFPTWHRPYLLEFERAMRRADMALGNDGKIGLPYWDWMRSEVDGQVMPRFVREVCMQEFAADFFPPEVNAARYQMSATKSDFVIKRSLEAAGITDQADRCLRSVMHAQHACTTFSSSSSPSLESPHNSIHGIVGGMMASYQSSFHPIFWMHHCNVDRLYEAYIELEPDSQSEFESHQSSLPRVSKDVGFPDGPWGVYKPFMNHKTRQEFHARDCFDIKALGFQYDALPKPSPAQMREMPYWAVFENINIRDVARPCMVYVYVTDKDNVDAWVPPADMSDDGLLAHPGLAGFITIFFLNTPNVCVNCQNRGPYDEYLDVTAALRGNGILPSQCAFRTIVVDSEDGVARLAHDRPAIPVPVLKGPRFHSMAEALKADDTAEVRELQRFLHLPEGCGGLDDEPTLTAIKEFQRAAGLADDGVVGARTKKALLSQLGGDESDARLECKPGDTVTWWVDAHTVPPGMQLGAVHEELASAFQRWADATGVVFARQDEADGAQISISWNDCTPGNEFAFDGPGGALARASDKAIVFDASERWELVGQSHHRRAEIDEAESFFNVFFKLLPVAVHEIGHVRKFIDGRGVGLSHSNDYKDVMSHFYLPDCIDLTLNDIARVKEIVGAQ